jgi:hypothetical protein
MFVRMAPLSDADHDAPAADTASPVAVPTVAVPNGAIVTTGQQNFVFVERSPGLMVKTPVAFARRGRDVSYVSEGLSPGTRVVTKGAILLDAELATDN